MSARQPGPYGSVARKWLALAERRRAHLVEMRENGRWIRYFTQAEFDRELRDLATACERLALVAGITPQPGEAVSGPAPWHRYPDAPGLSLAGRPPRGPLSRMKN